MRLTVYSGLDVMTFIFWLIATALLASHADDLDSFYAFIVTFGEGRALHARRQVKLESAPAKVDEVARYYGHAPRQMAELYNQTSYQHIAELNGQGYSYDATELYGRDPRYITEELETPKRRAELAWPATSDIT
ncbi:hypothetical protein CSOJ01_08690 [Colletotrichum sojae]|uniref:Uncharacterized protein n=1 Tax=Colletotrichum sojae TaxID=2175907 RepID=A0A8H6J4Y4_9PEZI|nr:hypothetical protein CSOJ01_08690 [Colletotrichum sojae]